MSQNTHLFDVLRAQEWLSFVNVLLIDSALSPRAKDDYFSFRIDRKQNILHLLI